MKRIINGRGTGKTQKLIEFAAIRGLPIFAANPQDIYMKALLMGYKDVKVYTYSFLLQNEEEFEDKHYLIDDLELFARYCAPGYLDGYTLAVD